MLSIWPLVDCFYFGRVSVSVLLVNQSPVKSEYCWPAVGDPLWVYNNICLLIVSIWAFIIALALEVNHLTGKLVYGGRGWIR